MSIGLATRLIGLVRQRLASDRLLRNVGWFSLAEAANRVSRLVTIVVLARMLDSREIGLAALALTCFELIRVVANVGVGPMVVRARPEALASTCAAAWRANWAICLGTAVFQIAVGVAVSQAYGRAELLWMMIALAGVYLVMPFGQIHASLIARDNRMGWIAGVYTVQIAADHFLCAGLALAGFGAWAIVLPKLIVAPVWVIGMRRGVTWQRDRTVVPLAAGEMARFSLPVLGSEMLNAVRLNADKMLVSAILGVEALGLYYFAFNAGIGLSLALTTGLAASSYPHFAEVAHRPTDLLRRFDVALKGTAAQIGLVIALQAAAIPLYVPLVLGARWEAVVPLAMMLCAGAVTKSAADLAAQMLRAAGLAKAELGLSIAMTVACLGVFAILLPFGLTVGVGGFALALLGGHVAQAVWARRAIQERATAQGSTNPGLHVAIGAAG